MKRGFTPLEIRNIITTDSVTNSKPLNAVGCYFQRERSRQRRDLSLTGFTLIELLVVISIIAILMTAALWGVITAIGLAKEKAAIAEIAMLKQAIIEYESDYGRYPPDDGGYSSKPLVDALKGDYQATPPKKAYFDFNRKRIVNGECLSPFYKPYHYRENASKNIKTDDMKHPATFDIWTEDRKGRPDGLNNWD